MLWCHYFLFCIGSAPSGFIKVEALERALTVYGADRLTQEQVQELINQIDTDQNGLFNYVEVNADNM